jgi:hypothetical protein
LKQLQRGWLDLTKKGESNQFRYRSVCFQNPIVTVFDTQFFLISDIKYAATPPNEPHRCILTDYFNNYNFNKLK